MFRFLLVALFVTLASAFMVPAMSPKLSVSSSVVMNEAAAKAAWLKKVDNGGWGRGAKAAPRARGGGLVPAAAAAPAGSLAAFAAQKRAPGEYPPAGGMYEKEGTFYQDLAKNGLMHTEGNYGSNPSVNGVVAPVGTFETHKRGPTEYPPAGGMYDKEGSFDADLAKNGLMYTAGEYGGDFTGERRVQTGAYAAQKRAPNEYPPARTMYQKEGTFNEDMARNGLMMSDNPNPYV